MTGRGDWPQKNYTFRESNLKTKTVFPKGLSYSVLVLLLSGEYLLDC